MNNEIVLDIETQNTFDEVGSRDCRKLRLSLLVAYFYPTSHEAAGTNPRTSANGIPRVAPQERSGVDASRDFAQTEDELRKTGGYRVYFEKDLPALWPRLQFADRVIGYNLNGFDYNVLNNYAPFDLFTLTTLDMMDAVYKKLGFRVKLDDLAHGSLGIGKSGNGLDAVRFWKNQELQKLAEYCKQDVKVTKEVYEYGIKNNFVSLHDRFSGAKKQIPVNFSPKIIESKPVNLTLGL